MIPVPWRARKLIENLVSACHYFANRQANRRARPRQQKLKILFCVPFYGYTGGAFAVLSAANLLSDSCDVSFLTHASNVMNRYVSRGVRMVDTVGGPYDLCVMECGVSQAAIAQAKRSGAGIIMTMHGAPDTEDGSRNHGYSDGQIADTLQVVDSIQYVSDVQRPFLEAISGIHYRKIPNYVLPVPKTQRSRAVGLVCDTTLPHKNVDAGIAAAQLSSASRIEVWGKYQDRRSEGRIRWNGFSSDKKRIYDSFDVLVHLSRLENQPLVILEAISAGVPCVLAPLPAYDNFRGVEGIYFADGHAGAVAEAIDRALNCPQDIRDGLVRFWNAHYSPAAVLAQWTRYLTDVRQLKEQGAEAGALTV
jgi:hypothetical protein